ncbi:MAG: acyltransferase [Methanobrevibacter sp.]|nr:acyltransferase [Candidatus Methanovirga procula]
MSIRSNIDRIFYLDFLRALAIVAVIILHVSEFYFLGAGKTDFNRFIGLIFEGFSRFAVPTFLTLSGALLFNRKYNLHDFFKRRMSRILIPFIFWFIVYILFSYFDGGSSNFTSVTSFLTYVGKCFFALKGTPNSHMWFVWLIFSLYLAVPIINKWISNSSLCELEYFLFIWIVCSLLFTFNITPSDYNLSLNLFMGSFGYLILGYYLANKQSRILDNFYLWFLVFLIISVFRIFMAINPSFFMFIHNGMANMIFLVQTASIFLVVKNFNFKKIGDFLKSGIVSKLILSLSKYSYGIYLAHMIFLSLFLKLSVCKDNALLFIPLLTVGALVTTWIVLFLMNRFSIFRKVTGFQ